MPDNHPDTVDVEVFARQHDWSDDDKDAQYLRPEARSGHVGVPVHRTGTECKVYLHT